MKQFSLDEILTKGLSNINYWDFFDDENTEIEIRYLSDFQNAKYLRDFIDNICKQAWIHPKWRTRIVLIIDELNNNAIEYGSGKWDTNILKFAIHITGQRQRDINACVTDSWKGNKPKTAKDMEKMREEMNKRGFAHHASIRWRGLFLIISKLVDQLYFKDEEASWLTVGFQKILSSWDL